MATTIVISTPAQYQVYQRDGSNLAGLAMTGTYTGTAPASVEASFNGGAFTVITGGSIGGGTWSGTLATQTAGQGTLTARDSGNPGVTGTCADVGIGDVFILGGNSIQVGGGTNAQSYTHATLKAGSYAFDDLWANGNDPIGRGASGTPGGGTNVTVLGSQWPLLATLIMAHTGVPVGFVSTGKGSTDIYSASGGAYWAVGNAEYNALLSLVAQAGTGANGYKGVLMHLGVVAVGSTTPFTQADYNGALTAFAAGMVASVTGAPKTCFAVFGEQSGAGASWDPRVARDVIRQAIIQTWNTDSNCGPGENDIEADYTGDTVHPKTDAELLQIARRWWPAIYERFYGGPVGYGRGPRVQSATLDTAKTSILLTVDRDLAAGTTYGGFRVVDTGVAATITSVTRTSDRLVTVLVSAPVSSAQNTTVSFGSGQDATGQVVPLSTAITLPDSNTITLAMEPTIEYQVTQPLLRLGVRV